MLDNLAALATTLIARHFPGIFSMSLEHALAHLLACVRVDRHEVSSGSLSQALVMAYLDPRVRLNRDPWSGSRAMLRLQLANGMLYALHLDGNVQSALRRLQEIGEWLCRQPYDVDAFEAYGASLSSLVNMDVPAEEYCHIQLAVLADLLPAPKMHLRMVSKMCLVALNNLRKDHGLRPLDSLPQEAKNYFASLLSDDNATIRAFQSRLNQSALALIDHFKSTYHRRYDDLNAYNFLIAENGQCCRNRIQAVQELPWLLRVLAGPDDLHSCRPVEPEPPPRTSPAALRQILQAIDAGKPLFDAIARALNVPRETVRWTHYRMIHNRRFLVGRIDVLLTLLSWLPAEKRPRSDMDWHYMCKVLSMLLSAFSYCWGGEEFPGVLLTEPRYGTIMRRWLRELLQPDLAAAYRLTTRLREEPHGLADLKDYLGTLLMGFHRYCDDASNEIHVAPCLGAMLDWLATQSLRRTIALSRRWHDNLQENVRPVPCNSRKGQVDAETWPAILSAPVQIGALSVMELTDTQSLIEEGYAMQHCVGSYASRCIMGGRMVVSVRDIDGIRLSTAAFALHDGPAGMVLHEHRGRKNTVPPEFCEQAIGKLLAMLNMPAHRNRLVARLNFQKAQRRLHDAARFARSKAMEDYDRKAEAAAWSCAFGRPPAEKSLHLASLHFWATRKSSASL